MSKRPAQMVYRKGEKEKEPNRALFLSAIRPPGRCAAPLMKENFKFSGQK